MISLHSDHIADLRKSGLSDGMIKRMQIESKDRSEIEFIVDNLKVMQGDTGYTIPYFSREGVRTAECNVRLIIGIPILDKAGNPTAKSIKYLKPRHSASTLYWPPGVHDLIASENYCIVTEGEKKAAKSVQEGIPCIAISGVWNWAEKKAREKDKVLGKSVSYLTRPLPELQTLAQECPIILLFDSDTDSNSQVNSALTLLRDALLFRGGKWVRKMSMPRILKEYFDQKDIDLNYPLECKVGIDDLLMLEQGVEKLKAAVKKETSELGDTLTPLAEIRHGTARDGTALRFIIPNSTPSDARRTQAIYKEVEKIKEDPDKAAPREYVIVAEKVASTRIWCSRVIIDIDGVDQNATQYEVAFVPLTRREPCVKRGDATIVNVNTRDDQYAHHGAGILQSERAAVAEVFHHCQISGFAKECLGTSKRGWVRFENKGNNELGFVKPQGVITKDGFIAGDRKDCPLLPIPNGSEDAALAPGLVQKGGEKDGALAILSVLKHPMPAMMCAAAVSGLLIDSCPEAENFIVHLYGASSGGKTTALRAAASLFGHPKGLLKQWRTTDNGLEAALVARNDFAIFLDETGMQKDPEVLQSSAYLIANATQKGRSDRHGGEREVRKFNIVALSTGEQTLLQGSVNGGQEARVVQLPADLAGPLWGKSDGKAIEDLTKALYLHHGWALEPLVRCIINSRRDDDSFFANRMGIFLEIYRTSAAGANGSDIGRRRAKAYALMTAAFELLLYVCLNVMEQPGDMPMLIAERTEAFSKIVIEKLLILPSDQYQQNETKAMVQYYYEQLSVNAIHIDGMIEDQKITSTLWGYRRGSKDGSHIGIMPSKFGSMCGTWGVERMKLALKEAGVLFFTETEAKTYGHRHSMRIKDHVTMKLYVVSYEKLIEFAK